MPYAEREFLPISALQHLIYCERQCALIHLERLWAENRFTAEGAVLHRRAHSGRSDTRPAGRTARSLSLCSSELGLFGVADIVQFGPDPGAAPLPIEYKRGKPKPHDADLVQLCAQALCLEESLGVPVPVGDIFYGKTRRRLRVTFDDALRARTRGAALRLHAMIASKQTPPAEPGPKCEGCSLREGCMPQLARKARSARSYITRALAAAPEPDGEGTEGDPS